MKKLLKNCRILKNNKLIETNILIENSKIKKITKQDIKADEVINVKNKIVIPGLIDCHVHFREPGLTHKEDFLSGSIAAAKGGITTILDMPNTIPPTITRKNLDEKRKLAEKSVVNYGFHFGAAKDNIDEIRKAKNIASVKLFMDISTGNMKIDDDKSILNILKHSKITTVHAEDNNVSKIIKLSNQTKNKLYLCHISTEKEINTIKKNKVKNKMFVEVTPHHLFLTEENVGKLGPFGKMKPSLKSEKDQKALWSAINTGIIDTIATDHAPHTKEEKEQSSPYGVPGVETMLPLLLDAVNNKKLTLQKLSELTSKNPAKIFKIKNKGEIKEGYDADLTVVDLNLKKQIHADTLMTKCGWSPFEGKLLKGWPVMTIVNGNIIYDNGNIMEIKAKEVHYG